MSFKDDLEKKLAEYKALLQEAQVKGNKRSIEELQQEIIYLVDARDYLV